MTKRKKVRPGTTVTNRLHKVKQPRGGYLKDEDFDRRQLGPGMEEMHAVENIDPRVTGTVVDYMTRSGIGLPAGIAFTQARPTAWFLDEINDTTGLQDKERQYEVVIDNENNKKELNDELLEAAIGLTAIDLAARSGYYNEPIIPDKDTFENLRTMIRRSLAFLNEYRDNDEVRAGLVFHGGYTNVVSYGEADYATKDTLWDFKVSKYDNLSKDHTLQVLMYLILGLHSDYADFYKSLEYIGFYNPRLNLVRRMRISDIDPDILKEVEDRVVCIPSGFMSDEDDLLLDYMGINKYGYLKF